MGVVRTMGLDRVVYSEVPEALNVQFEVIDGSVYIELTAQELAFLCDGKTIWTKDDFWIYKNPSDGRMYWGHSDDPYSISGRGSDGPDYHSQDELCGGECVLPAHHLGGCRTELPGTTSGPPPVEGL